MTGFEEIGQNGNFYRFGGKMEKTRYPYSSVPKKPPILDRKNPILRSGSNRQFGVGTHSFII